MRKGGKLNNNVTQQDIALVSSNLPSLAGSFPTHPPHCDFSWQASASDQLAGDSVQPSAGDPSLRTCRQNFMFEKLSVTLPVAQHLLVGNPTDPTLFQSEPKIDSLYF